MASKKHSLASHAKESGMEQSLMENLHDTYSSSNGDMQTAHMIHLHLPPSYVVYGDSQAT